MFISLFANRLMLTDTFSTAWMQAGEPKHCFSKRQPLTVFVSPKKVS
jgi:hypothetical protein